MSAATENAHGLITANAIKVEARNQGLSSNYEESPLNKKVSMVGSSLGGALTQFLRKEQGAFIEQKKMDAAARQGEETALNKVDAEAKRTGWQEAIYGQDEGYESAITKAAENSIRDAYLEEATSVDDYAALSVEEYTARHKAKLEQMLQSNPDDKNYRHAVTTAWASATEKLVQKQVMANKAYNQLTSRANADIQLRQELDMINVDMQDVRTPEDFAEMRLRFDNLLKGDVLDKGMHPVAKREAVNDAIFSSIVQGNIGVYNAMKEFGYDKKLTGAEQAKLDRALGAYTQDWGYQLATAFEEADLMAINAGTDLDTAREAWYKLDRELEALSVRSPKTPQADSILARYYSTSAGKRSQLDDVQERLIIQGLKHEQTELRKNGIREALRQPPLVRAGVLTEINEQGVIKTSELEQANDSNIIEDVRRLAGGDDTFSANDAVSAILTNPKIAVAVGVQQSNLPTNSPLVKRAFEHVLGGYASPVMRDELSEQPSPQLVTAIESLGALAQNRDKLTQYMNENDIAAFEILRRGVESRKTVPMIQEEIKNFRENKGNVEAWSLTWPTETQGNVDKTNFVAGLVSQYGGGSPKGASLAKYMTVFKDGLVIHGGDFDGAKDYLKDYVGGNNIQYRGKNIVGGKQLDDYTGEINFSATMEWLQQKKEVTGNTAFGEYMRRILPPTESGQYPQTLQEIPTWNMKVEDGVDGVTVYINNAVKPWRITPEQLRNWSNLALMDKKDKEVIDKAKIEAEKRFWQGSPMGGNRLHRLM